MRILDFVRVARTADGRSLRLDIELWDASGDKHFEACWPAILHEAHGVLMLYDPAERSQEKVRSPQPDCTS